MAGLRGLDPTRPQERVRMGHPVLGQARAKEFQGAKTSGCNSGRRCRGEGRGSENGGLGRGRRCCP